MADLNVLIAFDAATIVERNPGASRNPDAPTQVWRQAFSSAT